MFRLRILITSELRGLAGGVETYLRALGPQLVDSGHQVAWLFGQDVPAGGNSVNGDVGIHWIAPAVFSNRIPDHILAWKPDVVFGNGLHDARWDALLAKNYPTVFYSHAYFGACISGQKCFANSAHHICQRKLGIACLAIYLPMRCGGRNPFQMFKAYWNQKRRQRYLKSIEAVLVASEYMATEYLRQGVNPSNIKVLPLFPTGIAPDDSTPHPKMLTNRILYASRLTTLKGATFVVEAVSKAAALLGRNLTLIVAGNGPELSTIQADAKRNNVITEFVGWLSPARRNECMRNADVLLAPSIWPEPFGLIGIEAGCVGLPSVAFDVGGIRQWLSPGVSGHLAPSNPPTIDGLAIALANVLSVDETYQALRVGAWEMSRRFGKHTHVDSLLKILTQCIAQRRSTSEVDVLTTS